MVNIVSTNALCCHKHHRLVFFHSIINQIVEQIETTGYPHKAPRFCTNGFVTYELVVLYFFLRNRVNLLFH